MQWPYPVWRLRLIKAGLWPEGRLARLACYLAGMAAVLFALQKLLGMFAKTWGEHLGGWVGFLTLLAGVLFFVLVFRWVKRRILWRLRNRLIVTYVFIGVIPAVLLVGMALITLYGLAGQFAVFVVTSEIHAQLRSLEAANAAVSNELAARLERGETPTAESLAGLRKRDPAWGRRQVCGWYGDKPLPLCTEVKGTALGRPGFVKDKFRDLVREHDELHLRVCSSIPVGTSQLTVVTSEPFDKELVGKIAANLGEITLYTSGFMLDQKPTQPERAPEEAASPSRVTVSIAPDQAKGGISVSSSKPGGQTEHQVLHPTFSVGAVPAATGSFD